MSANAKARRFYGRRQKNPTSRGLIWGIAAAAVVIVAAVAILFWKRAKK